VCVCVCAVTTTTGTTITTTTAASVEPQRTTTTTRRADFVVVVITAVDDHSVTLSWQPPSPAAVTSSSLVAVTSSTWHADTHEMVADNVADSSDSSVQYVVSVWRVADSDSDDVTGDDDVIEAAVTSQYGGRGGRSVSWWRDVLLTVSDGWRENVQTSTVVTGLRPATTYCFTVCNSSSS